MDNFDLFEHIDFLDEQACEISMAERSFAQPQATIYRGDKWDQLRETLQNNDDLMAAISDTTGQPLSSMITEAVLAIRATLLDGFTISLALSGGKDSTGTLHLLLFAMIGLVREGRGNEISAYHWISHTDTQVENPEVRNLADRQLAAIQALIDKERLPLSIVVGKPSLASSWTGRVLTGRGLPTYVTSSSPQCSIDLKVTTGNRVKAQMIKLMPKEMREKVCLVLGSRDAEGVTRAGNIARRGGQATAPVKTSAGWELYPIRHWSQGDVWELLMSCGNEASVHLPLPSYQANNKELAELYRDATGECIWSASEKKVSDACGARTGCWTCLRGGTDKSMENMLYHEVNGVRTLVDRYAYMVNLNNIQRLLGVKQWSWEDRHPVGRTIYAGGFIKVQPDVFSPSFLARLLRLCCSADYVEQQRAEDLEMKLLLGEVDDNDYNQRMSKPQFRIVSPEQLLHVSWLWDFHCFHSTPFQAIEIYRSVWEDGNIELLTEDELITPVPATKIPQEFWLKIPGLKWGSDELTDGLSDPMLSATYFDGQNDRRAATDIRTHDGHRTIGPVETAKQLTIDGDVASWIIWDEYDRMRESAQAGDMTNTAAVLYLLRFGVVQITPSKVADMHMMAQRGQRMRQMGLSGDQSLMGIYCRSDLEILSTPEYRQIVQAEYRRHELKHLARARQMRRLCWISFTLDYHRQNNTAFWADVEHVLFAEQEAEAIEQAKRIGFDLECRLSSVIAVRVARLTIGGINAASLQLEKRWKWQIATSLSQLRGKVGTLVRMHLDAELVRLQRQLETGEGVSPSSVISDVAYPNATYSSFVRMVKTGRRLVTAHLPDVVVKLPKRPLKRYVEGDQLMLAM